MPLQDIVLNLLFVGADTRLKDARGFDVMVEAARGGHGDVIDVLTRSGAKAGISGVLQVRLMCVFASSCGGLVESRGVLLSWSQSRGYATWLMC
jgi:hypothetical protein